MFARGAIRFQNAACFYFTLSQSHCFSRSRSLFVCVFVVFWCKSVLIAKGRLHIHARTLYCYCFPLSILSVVVVVFVAVDSVCVV